MDQWTIIQFGKVCERERVQTTLTSEGEGLFKCLPYIMNESYIVTVSTKEGVVGLKYSKFCQRGLYTPSNGNSENYCVPRSGIGICNDKLWAGESWISFWWHIPRDSRVQ